MIVQMLFVLVTNRGMTVSQTHFFSNFKDVLMKTTKEYSTVILIFVRSVLSISVLNNFETESNVFALSNT